MAGLQPLIHPKKIKQNQPTHSAEANQPPIKRWAQLATRVWWLLGCLLPWLAASRLARWGRVHSFQQREVAGEFIWFHFISPNSFIPSLCFHSFTHKPITRWAACLLSWLVAVRLAAAHNQPKNKTIGPAKTAFTHKFINSFFIDSLFAQPGIQQLNNSTIDFIPQSEIPSIIELFSLFDSFNYCYNIFLINPPKQIKLFFVESIKNKSLLLFCDWWNEEKIDLCCWPFNWIQRIQISGQWVICLNSISPHSFLLFHQSFINLYNKDKLINERQDSWRRNEVGLVAVRAGGQNL